MHPRVLTLLACVPLLAALAVLALSTTRAAESRDRAVPRGPVGIRVATGAGAVVGAALAIAVLRRAPAPEPATPR